MAKLLVSVRSSTEALAAMAGGAGIIDIKEPAHGSLGRAPSVVWQGVRAVIPTPIPVSVALGELTEWFRDDAPEIPANCWTGLTYCKLGLSSAPDDWPDRWQLLRDQLAEHASFTASWVAVVYIDWQAARAPRPDSIIETASTIESCHGVLFDTWDKRARRGVDLDWQPQIDRVRASCRFIALAGSLDSAAIRRLAPLAPDIFAVRGAACAGGNRLATIHPERVKNLVRAAEGPWKL